MKSYNVKCKGCGAVLNNNPNAIGYVVNYEQKKHTHCKRCFEIKHYNKNQQALEQLDCIKEKLDNLDLTNYQVFIVLDIFDLYNSLIPRFKELKHVIYVVNKVDLLPKKYNVELTKNHIIDNLNNLNYHFKRVIFCTTKSNQSMKYINEMIQKNYKQKSIFIGKSNVGKSSIIRKLCSLNKITDDVVVSQYLNTTNDFNKIKINKAIIIDTPGFINDTSLFNYLKPSVLKKINYQQIKHPRTFQLKENRVFKIENLFSLQFDINNHAHVTFYINDLINISSCKCKEQLILNKIGKNIDYQESLPLDLHEYQISDINNKHNLVISGLGLIAFKNVRYIKILKPTNISAYLLSKQII